MNAEIFFNEVRRQPFAGTLSAAQVEGLNALLVAFTKFEADIPLRQFKSYMLGTTFWESGRTMQPVAEAGHGRGKLYGEPAGPYKQVYYGRGYVQLTWITNYEKFDALLHKTGLLTEPESLIRTPDLMLHPDVASATLILGMTRGLFTGKKLGDYFTPSRSDWVDARKIVNGVDHASTIAMIAEHFDAALVAAEEVA